MCEAILRFFSQSLIESEQITSPQWSGQELSVSALLLEAGLWTSGGILN